MRDIIKKLEMRLKPGLELKKTVTIGFDGFVDHIFRVIQATGIEGYDYFSEMAEFGGYVSGKSGKSCSLELAEQMVKFGGNSPIMANALGRMGFTVNCIGALGDSGVDEIFRGMSENCALYPVCRPGITTALEFVDGKIMLCDNKRIKEMTWDSVKSVIPVKQLADFFSTSDMLCLLNWSELPETGTIWQGLLDEVLPLMQNRGQSVFFDISDCSKRSNLEIRNALTQIRLFSRQFITYLSVNENELTSLYCAETDRTAASMSVMAAAVFERSGVDGIIIHMPRKSIYISGSEQIQLRNIYIEKPALSTGGGDNFNAGFCGGLLLGLTPYESIKLACAAGAFYVETGRSADAAELCSYTAKHSGHEF